MTGIDKDIFRLLPGCFLILDAHDADFRILAATEAYLRVSRRGEEIIGRPLFEVFPDSAHNQNEGSRKLRASLEKIIQTKETDVWDVQRYDVNAGEGQPFEVRYWKPANIPVPDEQGKIVYIIHNVVDVTEQTELSRQLKSNDERLQQQITDAITTTQELERLEIGRDLHDNINQLLVTANLYLGRALKATPFSIGYAEKAYEQISRAIKEIRNVSTALATTSFAEENLVASLEELIAHVAQDGAITVEKDFALPDESLIESKVKAALFRIVQEQFSNIVKHAEADKVSLRLHFTDNNVHLTISDNGKGFMPSVRMQGMGFQNMKSRVAMMDGSVTIESSPGDGCTIEINIPHPGR